VLRQVFGELLEELVDVIRSASGVEGLGDLLGELLVLLLTIQRHLGWSLIRAEQLVG